MAAVERSIIRAHEHFGLASLAYDPHQAEYLADRLTEADVPVERVAFTGAALQSMATSLPDVFGARQIDLYPHEQLLADLRSLRIEERSYGLRLTSPRGPSGHGDCATSGLSVMRPCNGVPRTTLTLAKLTPRRTKPPQFLTSDFGRPNQIQKYNPATSSKAIIKGTIP